VTRNLSKPAILGAPYDLSNAVVRSPFWPEASAHRDFWERHNCAYVYEYEPTDDGPEAEIIRAILATHTQFELDIEAVR
jgi:hypothetical protein